MYIGGKSAVEIADEFGTPVYVTDEQRVRENYRRIYGAFSRFMDTRVPRRTPTWPSSAS